jgi:hypothetical protein
MSRESGTFGAKQACLVMREQFRRFDWAQRIGGSGQRKDFVQTVVASDQGIYAGGQFNTEQTSVGPNQAIAGNRAGFVRRLDP